MSRFESVLDWFRFGQDVLGWCLGRGWVRFGSVRTLWVGIRNWSWLDDLPEGLSVCLGWSGLVPTRTRSSGLGFGLVRVLGSNTALNHFTKMHRARGHCNMIKEEQMSTTKRGPTATNILTLQISAFDPPSFFTATIVASIAVIACRYALPGCWIFPVSGSRAVVPETKMKGPFRTAR